MLDAELGCRLAVILECNGRHHRCGCTVRDRHPRAVRHRGRLRYWYDAVGTDCCTEITQFSVFKFLGLFRNSRKLLPLNQHTLLNHLLAVPQVMLTTVRNFDDGIAATSMYRASAWRLTLRCRMSLLPKRTCGRKALSLPAFPYVLREGSTGEGAPLCHLESAVHLYLPFFKYILLTCGQNMMTSSFPNLSWLFGFLFLFCFGN